jgi:hypothetical protein
MEGGDCYRGIAHSPDYGPSEWSHYFAVIEIVEYVATNQDLGVMVRP